MQKVYKWLSLNVAGLTNVIKRKRTGKFLMKEKAHCLYLQETHLQKGEEYLLRQVFKGNIVHVPAQSRSKRIMVGIATLDIS